MRKGARAGTGGSMSSCPPAARSSSTKAGCHAGRRPVRSAAKAGPGPIGPGPAFAALLTGRLPAWQPAFVELDLAAGGQDDIDPPVPALAPFLMLPGLEVAARLDQLD